MRRILAAVLCCAAAPALGASPTTLSPVVVTATRTPRPAAEVAPSVTVLTAAEIEASGARTLEEVLRGSVGLEVVSSGTPGALASPRIRGSTAAQVLVLLDGVRLNSPVNGQFNLADLPVPLSSIERIEVLRGPGSALYGAGALGGVIQLFTKRAEAEPALNASFSRGRFGARRTGIAGAWKPGPLGLRVAVAEEQSDGYRPNSDSEQVVLDASVTLDLPRGAALELTGRRLDKEAGTPGSTAWPSATERQEDINSLVSAQLKGNVGPVALRLLGQGTRFDNRPGDPGVWSDRHLAETASAEAQGELKAGPHAVTVVGEFAREFLDSTTNGKRDQSRWAVLAQNEWSVAPQVALTAGARYDAHSDFGHEWSPRASLAVRATEATTLRASVGRGYRAPTFNDRYWPVSPWAWGNPNLEPETAWEYEAGVSHAFGTRGSLALTGFRRDAEDLIEWRQVDPTDPWSAWSPVNVARTRTWGSEVSVDFQVCRGVTLGGAYTWLHPVDRDTREFLPNKPRHQGSGYVILEPLAETKLRVDGRYARYYPGAGRAEPAHTVFDATLTRPVYLGDVLALDVTLGVKNLFGRDYEVNPGYPMPPREWQVGVAASF